jgi:1-acyl-sn-glycerol-3-phosphate acyltransferase
MTAFFINTALFCAVACWILLFPERYVFSHARLWSRTTAFLLKCIMGITVRVRGLKNIPRGPALIAMRHESTWETVVMFLYLERFVFVLKKELLWIPFFGGFLKKLRCISVGRRGKESGFRAFLTQGQVLLKKGYNILIFPEGTRMTPGELRPLHSGFSVLYEKAHVPVVPAVLNSGRFWPRRCFYKHPGTITLQFLPAILPGMPRAQFLSHFEKVFTEAYQKLERKN